jgi:hypothetical protein
MTVSLYLLSFKIGDSEYGCRMPARSLSHAEELATAIGGKVLGTNVHEVSAIPPEQLMEFCNAISDEPIKWKCNAAEQLQSFLTMSWPVREVTFDSNEEGH